MNDSSEVGGKKSLFSENSSCCFPPEGINNPFVHFGRAGSGLFKTIIYLTKPKMQFNFTLNKITKHEP